MVEFLRLAMRSAGLGNTYFCLEMPFYGAHKALVNRVGVWIMPARY
jgi:hypothetical protein